VDWSTGQILRELEKLGIAGNTLVIFLSDNGGTQRSVNTPLRGFKSSTLEGGMRVPAVAWWPGRVPVGRSSDAVVSNMDILPTFAELSGGPLPKRKIDGQSLAELLRGGSGSGYDVFYFWHRNELCGVRQGRWKLHTSGELYNLSEDIGESRNVAAAHPDVVKGLDKLLVAARSDLGDKDQIGPGCRPVGKAKGPLRFLIPRHPNSEYPPQAPVKRVPGAPYG
jgi:arylsulfatase A-like enzyme